MMNMNMSLRFSKFIKQKNQKAFSSIAEVASEPYSTGVQAMHWVSKRINMNVFSNKFHSFILYLI